MFDETGVLDHLAFHNFFQVEIDQEVLSGKIREQKQDNQQILFGSLIKTIPYEAIIEVQNVRATGT